jgi:hypothetical protein
MSWEKDREAGGKKWGSSAEGGRKWEVRWEERGEKIQVGWEKDREAGGKKWGSSAEGGRKGEGQFT